MGHQVYIICGDKVTVYSKRGIKCNKKACKHGLKKLRERQRMKMKEDINQSLAG